MAYLSKQQYNYRRESAAAHNIENERIAVKNGMTETQASIISELCSLRHKFHCNMDSIAKGGNDDAMTFGREFLYIEKCILNNNLPKLSIYNMLTDIDDMNGLIYEYGDDVPYNHQSKEFQDWYDDNYYRIYCELSEVNKCIENYLTNIDKKYKTSFCPTGALRV